MEKIENLLVRICLRAAVIFLSLGIITRVISHYQNIHPAKLEFLFGITADAFLRFTDTCLFFAIAIALYKLISQEGSKS